MGEAEFNRLMQLRNQLVTGAENYRKEDNFAPVLIPTMSKDMDEKLKLAHTVVDVADRSNKKIGIDLLPYTVNKPENSYLQVRIFTRKKEEIFQ